MSWLGGIENNSSIVEQSVIQQTLMVVEDSGIISQIPQIFLDDSSVAYIEDIDPFFLNLIIKGKTFKNCMIES